MSLYDAPSDRDYYDQDMGDVDERDLLDRAADAQREQDSKELLALLGRYSLHTALIDVLAIVEDTYLDYEQQAIAQHAASYGWPSVLRVLARALEEQEQQS